MTNPFSNAGHVSTVAIPQEALRQAELLKDHCSAMFWAVIAPINNVAVMTAKDAYDALRRHPALFRRQNKMLARQAMQRADRYDKAVVQTMADNPNGNRAQYWLDYSDEHYEQIRRHIDIFRLTVLQVLTRNDVPNRDLCSRITVAETMLRYAVEMFDTFFRKIRELHHIDIERNFTDARLSYILTPWQQLTKDICRCPGKNICLDDDRDIRLAFQIIEQKLVSMTNIQNIGDTALQYNPDICQQLRDNPARNPYNQFSQSFN